MTATRETLREAVARAIANEEIDGWARLCAEVPDTADNYREDADAALAAIEAAGWRIVPAEPTEAMIDAFCPKGGSVGQFDFASAYRAMLAAAPRIAKKE